MTDDRDNGTPELARLRRRAEALTRRQPAGERDLSGLTTDETQRLVHDLDVHRIELEMQNDELRHTQAALEAARDRYSELFDLAPTGYFSLDAKGRILEVNLVGAELLGVGRQLLAERKLQEFVAARHQDRFFSLLRNSFRYPGRERCELEMERTDGSRFFAHMETAVAREDDGGQADQCLAAIVDITERRQAEEALREADRRKDEFLAVLAHELRNPLAPIRNAVAILKLKGTSDPTLQMAQDMIDRQLKHMVRLIDDLMDVSRITRGRLQLRRERIELAAVLEQALEASRPHIDGAGHALTMTLPPHPIHLVGDPVRLAQVFLNLLNNACKYTERGGSIRLHAERDGQHVVVRVTDTGIGIPPEHLPGLFEMFSQAGADSERSQGGLGIGLSLARGLVQMHGGSIEARSEGQGAGSEFIVRLPVLTEMTAPEPSPADRPDATEAAMTRRILVVDDNADIVESLAMILRLRGNEVETARNGLEAVEMAERVRPEVVLLDLGMPKLDGYAACRRIREQPWGADMVIIALTGLGQDDDRRNAQEAGFDDHLVKPVDPSVLLELLAGVN